MIVDPAYNRNRGVGLFFSLVAILVSTYQVILLSHRKRILDLKHWTHYCCLISANLTMISFIDSYGVYDILGLYAFVVLLYIMFMPLEVGCCMIIYSHFHAHYLTIRKPLPISFNALFITGLTLKNSISLIIVFLTWELNDASYMIIYYVLEEIWLIIFIFTDLVGYYLVRSAIIELLQTQSSFLSISSNKSSCRLKMKHESENEDGKLEQGNNNGDDENLNFPQTLPQEEPVSTDEQSPKPTTTTRTLKNSSPAKTRTRSIDSLNYLTFLSRMRKFHGVVFLCTIFFVLLFAAGAFDVMADRPHAQASVYFFVDPSHFQVVNVVLPYFALLFWGSLTWWSWIPFQYQEEDDERITETTKLPENQNFSKRTVKTGEENSEVGTITTSALGGEVEMLPGNSNSPTPSSRATMESQTTVTIAMIGEDGEMIPVH